MNHEGTKGRGTVDSTAVAEAVPSDGALIRGAHENFAEAYRLIARALPTGLVDSWPEAEVCAAGGAEGEFNRVYVFDEPADAAALIERARALFARVGVAWTLVASREAHAALGRVTFAHGLAAGESLPGMLRGADGIVEGDAAGLEIEEVSSAALAEIFVATLAAGFRAAREPLAILAAPGVWDAPGARSFIGWMEGEAVGTATCVTTGDIAGIYNVSTRRAWLRKGVGRAMTRAAGAYGEAEGGRYLSLQATPAGFPLYETMGFRTTAMYRLWHSFR